MILALAQNTSMMQRVIGTKFSVGVATVLRIIHQYKETGSITPNKKGNCGRKKKTPSTDNRFLLKKSKANPRLTAVDLDRNLRDTGVNLHASNVHCKLLAAGRKARKPVKKQLLTLTCIEPGHPAHSHIPCHLSLLFHELQCRILCNKKKNTTACERFKEIKHRPTFGVVWKT